jgi:hypothetical protein
VKTESIKLKFEFKFQKIFQRKIGNYFEEICKSNKLELSNLENSEWKRYLSQRLQYKHVWEIQGKLKIKWRKWLIFLRTTGKILILQRIKNWFELVFVERIDHKRGISKLFLKPLRIFVRKANEQEGIRMRAFLPFFNYGKIKGERRQAWYLINVNEYYFCISCPINAKVDSSPF